MKRGIMTRVVPIVVAGILMGLLVGMVSAAEQPYKGVKVRVLLEDTPWHRNIIDSIPQFEQRTGISMSLEFLPSMQSREKTNLDLTTGAGSYDAFLTDEMFIQRFVKMGVLEPLDKYISDSQYTKPGEINLGDYEPNVLSLATYDGTLYALPWRAAALVLLYRKDILGSYGVAVPQTMDELKAAAEKAHSGLRGDGIKNIYSMILRGFRGEGNNVYIWAGAFLPAYGAEWFDEKGNCTLDSREAYAATKLYVDLVRNYGPPDIPAMNWDHCWQFFQQGNAALWIDSAVLGAYVANPADSPVADTVGFAKVPAGPNGTPAGGLYEPAYIMAASARNKGATWEFMKMAASRDQMLSDAVVGGNFEIASRWVIETDQFAEAFPYPGLVKAYLEMRKVAREARPLIFNWPEVGDTAGVIFQDAISGEIPVEVAMKRMTKAINNIMKLSR